MAKVKQWWFIISLGVLWLVVCVFPQNAQGPTMTIVTPANGTTVAPGTSVHVSVSATPDVTNVGIIVKAPNAFEPPNKTAPPYDFDVSIPQGRIGPLQIVAFSVTGPGQGIYSPPLTLNVVPVALSIGLAVNLDQIAFDYVGQQVPLTVNSLYADGSKADVTKVATTSYTSNNTGVAMVSNAGLVTATGPGFTDVIIQYGAQTKDATISVPNNIRGDLDGDGRVTQDDLNVLLDALNTPATTPRDARDLNGDGRIDDLDAQILISLCSGCCTAPIISNAAASPNTIWPPNKKMIPVTVSYTESSTCPATCSLSITSNEPTGGQDWQVLDANHVMLSADRLGSGTGRVYTITIRCANAVGEARAYVTVTVPHDQGK